MQLSRLHCKYPRRSQVVQGRNGGREGKRGREGIKRKGGWEGRREGDKGIEGVSEGGKERERGSKEEGRVGGKEGGREGGEGREGITNGGREAGRIFQIKGWMELWREEEGYYKGRDGARDEGYYGLTLNNIS